METTIETPSPTKIEIVKINFQPVVKHQTQPTSSILSIGMTEDYTRIDFVTSAGHFTWVQIDPKTFIRPVRSDFKLTLVKAQGIPLAPRKYYFKNRGEPLYYTLYFPALPKGIKRIDIIEKESPESPELYFNFYSVSLARVKSERISVGN